ncbi:MAG TPA: helix-turn-helix transcriptional regulator [Sedimentisphaerales bacterium]|nr:helix-turn-helix transcriptional regulator [Sedimentisphaerales bacterium]
MKLLRKQMLDGNVQTMLLAILEAGPSYGYAIVKDLNTRAKGILQLGEGTIYPVLHRMEEKKLISASWRNAENGRERKYYRLTAKGRRALTANCQQWRLLTSVMKEVLGPAAKRSPEVELKGAAI